MRTSKQSIHDKAISLIKARLGHLGLTAEDMPENASHFDLLLSNGVRCEVKAAEPRAFSETTLLQGWVFNLHRHGKVDKRPLDFYILYCLPPKGANHGVWLVVPWRAIKDKYTVIVTWKNMAIQWGKYEGNFSLLKQ